MPLIDFRGTTLWKAFLLNALATSMIVVVAFIVKKRMESFVDEKGNKITHILTTTHLFYTFLVTFLAAIISYVGLFFLFGFGGGMLAQP